MFNDNLAQQESFDEDVQLIADPLPLLKTKKPEISVVIPVYIIMMLSI